MYNSPKNTRAKAIRGKASDKRLDSVTAVNPNSIRRSLSADNDFSISPALLDAIKVTVTTALIDDSVLQKLAGALAPLIDDKLSTMQSEIDVLKTEISELKNELYVLKSETSSDDALDNLEQYHRRNNVRIFGISESTDENTDSLVLDLFKNKMGLQLDPEKIDRSHRVGRKNPDKNRPRPIIVKFVSYRTRSLVYDNKSKLKGSGVLVREDLTRRRVALYRLMVATYGLKNVHHSAKKNERGVD